MTVKNIKGVKHKRVYILCDSVTLKFRNQPKESMRLETRSLVLFEGGAGGGMIGKQAQENFPRD